MRMSQVWLGWGGGGDRGGGVIKCLFNNCYGSFPFFQDLLVKVNGSGPFGRCVLCSCNNRSKECGGETGACKNCQVGTYGDRCQLCTNNVQGPECTQCKPGYWGLTENGCQGTRIDQHLPIPLFSVLTSGSGETGS